MKTRIAPHGNENSHKAALMSECCMCPPVVICISLTISTIKGWHVTRIDVKSGFLQTGPAGHEIHVKLPRVSQFKNELWLLLVEAHGLPNSNAKWKIKSDESFQLLGLQPVVVVPQLFYMKKSGVIVLVVVKIVDDLLATGENFILRASATGLGNMFQLSKIVHDPGQTIFYRLHITQQEDFYCKIHGDENLNSPCLYPLNRMRCFHAYKLLIELERKAFMSINASFG